MAACDAPPGSWCNGTQHIVAAAARSLAHPQPPVFAHRVLKDAPSLPHEQRALAAPVHHGGCCCDICTSHCASSAVYNCDTCTGAATHQCALCYYRALNHSHHHDTCYDPPHSPPMPETKICQSERDPSYASPQRSRENLQWPARWNAPCASRCLPVRYTSVTTVTATASRAGATCARLAAAPSPASRTGKKRRTLSTRHVERDLLP